MKRKLFFITGSLSGGGAERVISNLANYFSERYDYQVTMVCLNKEEIKYLLSPNVTLISLVERNNSNIILFRIYYALLTFFRLLKLIKKEQPNCCISFTTTVNIWTGICCFLLNKRYIVSERTSPYYTLEKLNILSKWLSYRIYKKAKAVVLPSKKMAQVFKNLKLFKRLNNLAVIYNPVNVFSKPVSLISYPKPFILSVGRIDYNKGFDLVIDAFYSLKEYDIDLLISGEGPNKDILKKKAADLDLGTRVKFIGFRNNLQDYYSQASVFVSGSRVEGYPNALVEAMSLGCPVVATDCDFGPSEIIKNGVNGLLVGLDDREAFTNAIETLLVDKQLRLEFSKNAKIINDTNSIKNIAEEWNNLILT